MLTVSTQKTADPLKPSILILMTPTFIQVFVKTSLSMPGAWLWISGTCGFIKELINIHTVILQRQQESLARNVERENYYNRKKKMS